MPRPTHRCPCCGQKPIASDAPAWNASLGTISRFGKIVIIRNNIDASLFDCLWRYRTRDYYLTSYYLASDIYSDNPDKSPFTVARGIFVRSKRIEQAIRPLGLDVARYKGPNGGYRLIIKPKEECSAYQINRVGREADQGARLLQPRAARPVSRPGHS